MNVAQIPDKDGRPQEWTVKDLRSLLDEVPDDMLVVVSSDAEGNAFHPLMEVWDGAYYRKENYGGDIVEGRPRKADRKSIVLVPMD